jgi:hypothetical protein
LGAILGVGIVSLAAEVSETIHDVLNFYNPVGPLSGKTTVATSRLVAWLVLSGSGERRQAMRQVNWPRLYCAVGLLLTFPPVWGFFIG